MSTIWVKKNIDTLLLSVYIKWVGFRLFCLECINLKHDKNGFLRKCIYTTVIPPFLLAPSVRLTLHSLREWVEGMEITDAM